MNATLDNPTLQSQATTANRNWQPVERTFRTFDGTELFYRAWLPDRAKASGAFDSNRETLDVVPKAPDPLGVSFTRALILFHRGHEHSGRWQEFVEALNAQDTAV